MVDATCLGIYEIPVKFIISSVLSFVSNSLRNGVLFLYYNQLES